VLNKIKVGIIKHAAVNMLFVDYSTSINQTVNKYNMFTVSFYPVELNRLKKEHPAGCSFFKIHIEW